MSHNFDHILVFQYELHYSAPLQEPKYPQPATVAQRMGSKVCNARKLLKSLFYIEIVKFY